MTIVFGLIILVIIIYLFRDIANSNLLVYIDFVARKFGYTVQKEVETGKLSPEDELPVIEIPTFFPFPKLYVRTKIGKRLYKELYKSDKYLKLSEKYGEILKSFDDEEDDE